MKAIQVQSTGGPEVLQLRDVPDPVPHVGDALVRVHTSGVNFMDVYFREGKYKAPLPFIPGGEGTGHVEALGDGVIDLAVGDAVAWLGSVGGYAEKVVVPADRLVKVPAALDLQTAAALMIQGVTAYYLSHLSFALKPGDTALVHAAAGGVGLLLTQMAKRKGAVVVATVSTTEKAQLARDAGADEVIIYTKAGLMKRWRGSRKVTEWMSSTTVWASPLSSNLSNVFGAVGYSLFTGLPAVQFRRLTCCGCRRWDPFL
jgi:NADPH2:quinone reductase